MIQNALLQIAFTTIHNLACLGKISIKGRITIGELLQKLNGSLQITGNITNSNQPTPFVRLDLLHLLVRNQPGVFGIPVHAVHQHRDIRQIFTVEDCRVVLRVIVVVRFVERPLSVFYHVVSVDFCQYNISLPIM